MISDFKGNIKAALTGKEIIAANKPVYPEILEITGNFMNNDI